MIGIVRALRYRRVSKNNIRRLALACLAAVGALGAQQPAPANRPRLADAVLADLANLSDLERTFFATNGRYTDDVSALHFKAASGAVVTVSYASARTFSASASHARLAPFLCFVIVSAVDADSPADKPFCTDSRYGTAATSLARAGTAADSDIAAQPPDTARVRASAPQKAPAARVAKKKSTPSVESPAAHAAISPQEFAARLRSAALGAADSAVFVVQFAVNDARYDPERGILEVTVERIPLPSAPGADSTRPAFTCFTRPVFVCGQAGLSYIARDVFHVPRSRAPDAALLSAGLVLQARFSVGRRAGTPGPALTLLALVLQAKGDSVAHWEPAAAP
jgi:hypothetical protein